MYRVMRRSIDSIANIIGGRDPRGSLRIAAAFRIEGMTQQEIAEREGISQPAVAKRLARLRRVVAKMGITEGALVDILRDTQAA